MAVHHNQMIVKTHFPHVIILLRAYLYGLCGPGADPIVRRAVGEVGGREVHDEVCAVVLRDVWGVGEREGG